MIIFLFVLIFLAILWPRAVKFTLALLLLIGLWNMPTYAAVFMGEDKACETIVLAKAHDNNVCKGKLTDKGITDKKCINIVDE